MTSRCLKPVAAVLVVTLLAYTPGLYAASIPSKMEASQSLDARANELAAGQSQFASDQIVSALAAEGLSPEQIETRLAQLTTDDLMSLRNQPAQIRSAGISMSRKTWIILGIGAAVVVGALVLSGDDDDDDSDDGED